MIDHMEHKHIGLQNMRHNIMPVWLRLSVRLLSSWSSMHALTSAHRSTTPFYLFHRQDWSWSPFRNPMIPWVGISATTSTWQRRVYYWSWTLLRLRTILLFSACAVA